MHKTLILYESKYGTTQKIAKNIALILGPSVYCKVDNFKERYKDYEFFVIGSPVYREELDEKIVEFVRKNLKWLKNKNICLFCTCNAGEYGMHYLNELKNLLGDNVVYSGVLGGEVILEKLTKDDYESMMRFYEKINRPKANSIKYDLEEVIKFALKAKEIKDSCVVKAPIEIIVKRVYKFIRTHNTCTLSTGYKSRVRSTPVEYNYDNKNLYIITEGGEKFANILQNGNVTVSIYDSYTSLSKLAGMQIEGKALLVEHMSDEYFNVLKLKKIEKKQLEKIPVILNVLRIEMTKIEFLYSKFKEEGYDIGQVLYVK
ncbi:flavodoxin domain-containing protein [Clostridiaceae bacterium M8S5]|nr:flavodoxin domain-containing protein [Clostridiaceae bacterium M8S5]